ncbi:hypothetical protein PND37_15015 [Lactiplantibacillus plantarum]|uniref:Uncharacterized protein n=2 Tax=Lactiplantibacillus pentosus TaxID=1589 RepID=A0AAX6LH16_LACPE|nr:MULTISPECIES: hypothetical protein [Lactiplantibacillus]DAF82838.1 MAG TPA: hypothetical protein [Caudoviricetes sp.]AGE39951.1 Hypothetical protein zj316_2412 [Lactiplantibacillus plantarum ZJ316]AYJ42493.1 hypothetical protein LP314_11750 [Lactiplantibacillus pentosus]KRK24925.1 hypothetical protein FD24_GL003349 [Lactiplantibacillus pentosus DSM 20314]KWT48969.1 hypothetical protein ABB42_13640 [Lactiplantibacillus plantarum]
MEFNLMPLNEFNKLAKKDQPTYFYGAISQTIFSFNGNKEIPLFLKTTFNIEFKDYVFRAKPLIVSRTIKIFFNDSSINFKEQYKKLLNYYANQKDGSTTNKTPNKKSNANDYLEKWLRGI